MKELVRKARSIRRFDQSKPISRDELIDLVDTARLVPCGMNGQPLRYKIISDPAECAAVFPHTVWAGALKGWDGPSEGERPTGYIAIVTKEERDVDVGIAAQTIHLAAAEMGYGCCMLGAIKRKTIARLLNISDQMTVRLLLAFGVPGETVVLEEISCDESKNYYRTEDGVHHVPKIRLEEILIQ